MQQPVWISRELFWAEKTPVLEGHIQYASTEIRFLKWQNYSNGEQTDGCQGREVGIDVKGQMGDPLLTNL